MGKRSRGLPPIEGKKARVLILGTMLGAESLRRREYYAHGRNAFWGFMGQLGVEGRSYSARCAQLRKRGIAVWDVLASCERKGSSDSKIRSPKPNDIAGFVRRHPELRLVAFNGKKAEDLFWRLCDDLPEGVEAVWLPSTSPANARPGKSEAWLRALRPALARGRRSTPRHP